MRLIRPEHEVSWDSWWSNQWTELAQKSQEQIPSSTPWMRIDTCQISIGYYPSCSPTTEPSIVAEGAFDFNGPPNLNKTSGHGPTEWSLAFTCSLPLRFNWVLKFSCADLRGVRTTIKKKKKTKKQKRKQKLELLLRALEPIARARHPNYSRYSFVLQWFGGVILIKFRVSCGSPWTFQVIVCLFVYLFVGFSFKANGARLWCNGSGEDARR